MNFYGFNGITELTSIRGWDPRNGYTLRRRWRGMAGPMDTLEAALKADGIPFMREVEEHGGYNLITATYGAPDTQPVGQALADYWNLVGNDLEKSLWDSPKLRTIFNDAEWFNGNGVPTPQYIDMRRDIMDVVQGTKLLTDLTWWEPENGVGAGFAILRTFLGDLVKGAESFMLSQWVLRRTTVVAKGCSVRPTLVNVNKIYTTTPLLRSWESVPEDAELPFDVPAGIWLKKSPSFDQVGPDKWQITQEFWHADSYAKTAYEAITTSPP